MNAIKQILFMGLCSFGIALFTKTSTALHVSTGFSINHVPYSFYTGYLGDNYRISKPKTTLTPNVMASYSYTWSDFVSPLTGCDDAQFTLGLTFYAAFGKQKFKATLSNNSTGADNLFGLQDLVDTRLYLLGSYQLWKSKNIDNSKELWLTSGLGLAFNMLKRFTLYEKETNAAIGVQFAETKPFTFSPFIGIDWYYKITEKYSIKGSYAYSYARSSYRKRIVTYKPDANASNNYQILYNATVGLVMNLQSAPEMTIHSQILSIGLTRKF